MRLNHFRTLAKHLGRLFTVFWALFVILALTELVSQIGNLRWFLINIYLLYICFLSAFIRSH